MEFYRYFGFLSGILREKWKLGVHLLPSVMNGCVARHSLSKLSSALAPVHLLACRLLEGCYDLLHKKKRQTSWYTHCLQYNHHRK